MKLNFMLIDDNEIDLYINQKFIEKQMPNCEILTFIRAKMAISFLSSLEEPRNSDFVYVPDIILVDINMPEMNGFGFLNAFTKLEQTRLKKTKIYMLSSSTNLNDLVDANTHNVCNGFLSKPLSKASIRQIVNESALDQTQND